MEIRKNNNSPFSFFKIVLKLKVAAQEQPEQKTGPCEIEEEALPNPTGALRMQAARLAAQAACC